MTHEIARNILVDHFNSSDLASSTIYCPMNSGKISGPQRLTQNVINMKTAVQIRIKMERLRNRTEIKSEIFLWF